MAFKEGDLIATQIGFLLDGNAFFDFGIYDDLKKCQQHKILDFIMRPVITISSTLK